MAVALAYDVDTVVISVGEPDPDPEGIAMQIRVDSSAWHRKALTRPGQAPHTACGLAIDLHFNLGTRFESYEGQLCTDGCYTRHELAESAAVNAEADRDP